MSQWALQHNHPLTSLGSRLTSSCMPPVRSDSSYRHGTASSLLSGLWLPSGIWPSIVEIGQTAITNSSIVEQKTLLDILGLGFAKGFAQNLSVFLESVLTIQLNSGSDMSGALNFTCPFEFSKLFDISCCFFEAQGSVGDATVLSHDMYQESMGHYYRFWQSQLRNPSGIEYNSYYQPSWEVLTSYLQSFFSEYCGHGYGWRVGRLGRAESMEARLSAHSTALQSSLVSLYFVHTGSDEPTVSDPLKKRLLDRPLSETSVASAVTKDAIALVRRVLADPRLRGGGESSGSRLGQDASVFFSILKHTKQICSILSMLAFEQLLFLIKCNGLCFMRSISAMLATCKLLLPASMTPLYFSLLFIFQPRDVQQNSLRLLCRV